MFTSSIESSISWVTNFTFRTPCPRFSFSTIHSFEDKIQLKTYEVAKCIKSDNLVFLVNPHLLSPLADLGGIGNSF